MPWTAQELQSASLMAIAAVAVDTGPGGVQALVDEAQRSAPAGLSPTHRLMFTQRVFAVLQMWSREVDPRPGWRPWSAGLDGVLSAGQQAWQQADGGVWIDRLHIGRPGACRRPAAARQARLARTRLDGRFQAVRLIAIGAGGVSIEHERGAGR